MPTTVVSTPGNLTIVNLHAEAPKVYWNGQLVEYVVSIHASNKDQARYVALKIQNPVTVPGLTSEQVEFLLTLHAAMGAAGIDVNYKNN